ncbi:MAG TPA: hypothetical protein VKB46_26730, partial [Pyrinomonadaceae bacterium]|nr:hypothetical protein [Pyrinomonadaceae bacterium]
MIRKLLFIGFFVASATVFFAQTRNRPAPSAGDLKVKYRVTNSAGGSTQESVTMIKGARERSEMQLAPGYNTVNILQCDKKQTIQISDTARKYFITSLQTDEPTTTARPAPTNAPAGPTRQGGVVTYTTTSVDTGERKEMFGFTARHVKSSMTIESSPDACNRVKQRTEMDGWYIDLNVALDCRLGSPGTMPTFGAARPTCRDQARFRREGTGKIGYPLIETMTIYGEGGQVTYSTTKEVVELSREPLDIALFDVPAGYTEAASSQELFAMPSMASMMGQASGQTSSTGRANNSISSAAETKSAGTIRVGVAQINNKSGHEVSADTLRDRLVSQIGSTGIEAVSLNALSPAEADAEAKAKQCDFVLFTDVATLKGSKLGGMFGRVTGVS